MPTMATEQGSAGSPWDDPAWRADATAWIDKTLAGHGRTRTGPVEPRVRPWSLVAEIATDAPEPVWFKHNAPGAAYEIPLSAALGRWAPDRVLVPLAVDVERVWMLLPDGGPTLRESDGDADTWERVLGLYAELQIGLTDRVPELVAMGAPDLRPAELPAALDGLLAEPRVAGALGDDLARLLAFRPTFARWCEELAATGIPASLDHSDLHYNNVLPRGGRPAVYDWGDSAVAHPFTSLLVASRFAAKQFPGIDTDRLRDAYLEPWSGYGTGAELRAAVPLAMRVGPVGRALTWWRLFPQVTDEVTAEHAEAAAEWLAELLVLISST
jgi:phosphotransferase family enzyme